MHIKAMSVAWSYDPELASLPVGITKAIVSFYRINSDTAFERHRSRIPNNDANTVKALEELSSTYGLGYFEIKMYHMAQKLGGKRDNLSQQTNSGNWSFQTCWMAQKTKWTVCIFSALGLLDGNCYKIICREISSSEAKDSPRLGKYKGQGKGFTTSCLHEETRFQQSGLDGGTRKRF